MFRDKPRKEGGGKGSVGNYKDDLKADKYIKEGEEETGAQEEQKPVEPEGITLE